MKIKKITRTIIIFLTSMILICVLIALGIAIATGNREQILDTALNYLLYIIGYGSLMHDNIFIQELFGIFGIVILSILSAYLTVNLFWRVDDVFISKNLALWKNTNNKYFASVLIGNKGKNICKLELSFVAYDERKNPLGEMGRTFTYPLLIKNGIWKIDMPIDTGFLFDVIRLIRKGRKDCMLYGIFGYVDSETGQDSIKVQEYSSEHIFVSKNAYGFNADANYSKKQKWHQFKSIDKNKEEDNALSKWICRNIISFDLSKAKAINDNQLKLSSEIGLQAQIDFTNTDTPPEFVIALLDFNKPYMDWSSYHEKGSLFSFEISGDEGIKELQLEVKNSSYEKLLDERIVITDEITKHTFKLDKNKDLSSESFSETKEICFTIFNKPDKNTKGSFIIYSCDIIIQEESRAPNA